MKSRSIDECIELASFAHPKAYPPPIGGTQIPVDRLRSLREYVVASAEEYGFPRRAKKKDSSLSGFDNAIGERLYSDLCISPVDAGYEETWNFLTLVVFPDIANWRYPNESKIPDYERWIGKPRNVFRKIWWRMNNMTPTLSAEIGEDEGVGIMERTTLGFNPRIAQSMVKTHVDLYSHDLGSRSDAMRVFAFQVQRLSKIIELDCLSEDDLRDLLIETYGLIITKAKDEFA